MDFDTKRRNESDVLRCESSFPNCYLNDDTRLAFNSIPSLEHFIETKFASKFQIILQLVMIEPTLSIIALWIKN